MNICVYYLKSVVSLMIWPFFALPLTFRKLLFYCKKLYGFEGRVVTKLNSCSKIATHDKF